MKKQKSAIDYIENHPERKRELTLLRDIIRETELTETIKWGVPCYSIDGKNVVAIAAFKSYVGLWFYQGVFLSDPKKVLINANEENTKALRQWRFHRVEDIDPKAVKQYVMEAIDNQKKGKEIKAVKAKKVEFPTELLALLAQDKQLKTKFETLTPGKQREYAEHIGSAKQEKTRLSRLEKAIPLIEEGKGLHDKYRK
ncbi:MAG: DUF1801 domain-containing protein [Crocinitomicaceae bacterium]